ncbi:putative serine protease family S33 [Phytophthora cinnamomi]|uniref:putative serine protease family S33 n=1 Tax=Phytophthora cinnamomi TaxID=4785 RepID=UPI00355ABE98|nr:putative serine protease family S33 [Phytophthora cinnamomi]
MGNANARLLQPHSRLALALLLVYLGRKALGRSVAWILMRWHFLRAAETPRLVFRATDGNKKLLSLCPTITKNKYYPPWRLFNGHLQTVRFAYDERGPKINYKRQLMTLPDGGVVSLDWALLSARDAPAAGGDLNDAASTTWLPDVEPTRRTVILLPGLTGGSPENYIRSTVARLHELGWQCVVLNARGCANTPVRTAQLFCSAYTGDLRFVLQQLSEKYQFAQEAFVGVGFSMGSNVLVKYLGEDGDETPLTGAISVGNPFDLTICSANFGGSLFNRMTYDKALNNNLRELFFNKCNAAEQFVDFPGVDLEAIKATRTVRDFDDTLTKYVFHYDTVDDYYDDAGSVKKLGGVRVPLLCINAEDDPISISSALPKEDEVKANPNVILCTTKSGGHLAFYESSLKDHAELENGKTESRKQSNMWTVNPIAEFAEAVRLNKLEIV